MDIQNVGGTPGGTRTFLLGMIMAIADRVLELAPGKPPHLYGGTYDEYVAASGHAAPGMREL